MPAFFIATTRIKNPEKFQDYAGKATQSFARFGGELVVRGKAVETLAGKSKHQAVGVVRFPDMEALTAWYGSPEYQALIPLRKKAAHMTITAYEEPA